MASEVRTYRFDLVMLVRERRAAAARLRREAELLNVRAAQIESEAAEWENVLEQAALPPAKEADNA